MSEKPFFQAELNSEADLKVLARQLCLQFKPGDLVGLSGPLGAGKTTLVRYLAECLGCSEPVSSPSYVLCHEYRGPVFIEHWDLYRPGEVPPELWEPAPDRIRFIEWIDKFSELNATANYLIALSLKFNDAQPTRKIELIARV